MLCDGAYGTLLNAEDTPRGLVDELCMVKPSVVIEAHLAYISAGARRIQTNSFMAYSQSAPRRRDLYRAAIECAREAVEASTEHIEVCATIGPAGDEPRDYYRDIEVILDSGIQCVVCETLTTKEDARAFVSAWREVAQGVTARATTSVSLNPDATREKWDWVRRLPNDESLSVGLNCCGGLSRFSEMLHTIGEDVEVSRVLPSAGSEPDAYLAPQAWAMQFAEIVAPFPEIAEVFPKIAVGGCCGTTPDHIAALAALS